MRLVLVQPNYHADGVNVVGCWSPEWIASVGGALATAGFDDVTFVDAMTTNIGEVALRDRLRALSAVVVTLAERDAARPRENADHAIRAG